MKYRTVRVPYGESWATAGTCRVDKLIEQLAPGERIISVYPLSYCLPPHGVSSMPMHIPVVLEALIEVPPPPTKRPPPKPPRPLPPPIKTNGG